MSRDVAVTAMLMATVFALATAGPVYAQSMADAGAEAGIDTGTATEADMAQDYIRQAKRNMGLTVREDCGKADADGAIIVCGRRGENPNRLPLPDEREDLAGKRVRGDIPRANANAPRTYGCSVVGQTNQCTGGLNAMSLAGTAIKLITKIVDPEAEVEKPARIPDKYKGSNK